MGRAIPSFTPRWLEAHYKDWISCIIVTSGQTGNNKEKVEEVCRKLAMGRPSCFAPETEIIGCKDRRLPSEILKFLIDTPGSPISIS